ncbi:MAG: DAK2 domain-containing protein, partial [Bacillota bacterium]
MEGAAARQKAELFLSWVEAGVRALERERANIDALNVFPVPDGDTGTNMFLTMSAAWREVQQQPAGAPLSEVVTAASR